MPVPEGLMVWAAQGHPGKGTGRGVTAGQVPGGELRPRRAEGPWQSGSVRGVSSQTRAGRALDPLHRPRAQGSPHVALLVGLGAVPADTGWPLAPGAHLPPLPHLCSGLRGRTRVERGARAFAGLTPGSEAQPWCRGAKEAARKTLLILITTNSPQGQRTRLFQIGHAPPLWKERSNQPPSLFPE